MSALGHELTLGHSSLSMIDCRLFDALAEFDGGACLVPSRTRRALVFLISLKVTGGTVRPCGARGLQQPNPQGLEL